MSRPHIVQTDESIGFHWVHERVPVTLAQACSVPGAEPDRWLPTHLAALDDVLIDVAGRFGEVLGGGRPATAEERSGLTAAYLAIDRATAHYAEAVRTTGQPMELRSGQIVGTGVLLSVRARFALGLMGPAPFDGRLDEPSLGVVGGHAGLEWVEAAAAWQGARWIVRTQDGRRLPATLSMLLHDSSGVLKDSALDEHRDALARCCADALTAAIEPITASGAVDWLLFDWLMAHRDGPDSGAVEIRSGKLADAELLVTAAAASVQVRSRFDPGLTAIA